MPAKLKVIPNKQREALAQAIAEATVARRAATKAREAKERSESMIATAEAKLGQAAEGIDHARNAQATQLAKAATSGKSPPTASATRTARLRETDARDTYEAAKAALATCEQTLADREYDLTKAQDQVAKAADDVIRAEAAHRVLKDAKAFQEKLIAARVALRYLHANNLLPEALMPEARTLLGFRAFPAWIGNIEYRQWEKHAEHQRWLTLHEELMKDADADVT
jgi:hypothetical protein